MAGANMRGITVMALLLMAWSVSAHSEMAERSGSLGPNQALLKTLQQAKAKNKKDLARAVWKVSKADPPFTDDTEKAVEKAQDESQLAERVAATTLADAEAIKKGPAYAVLSKMVKKFTQMSSKLAETGKDIAESTDDLQRSLVKKVGDLSDSLSENMFKLKHFISTGPKELTERNKKPGPPKPLNIENADAEIEQTLKTAHDLQMESMKAMSTMEAQLSVPKQGPELIDGAATPDDGIKHLPETDIIGESPDTSLPSRDIDMLARMVLKQRIQDLTVDALNEKHRFDAASCTGECMAKATRQAKKMEGERVKDEKDAQEEDQAAEDNEQKNHATSDDKAGEEAAKREAEKPEPKATDKKEAKPEPKAEDKKEAKPEPKAEDKKEAKPEPKAEDKKEAKPEKKE